MEAFQKFNETSKKVPFEVSLPKKGNENFESLILNKTYFAPNNLDEVRKLMEIHMFVSLRQPLTQCERPNFFVLIFVVVAIQKKVRPGSLYFFQIATTKKSNQKQIDTSHLVFNLLITADATKKTIVANMNLSKVEQENIRLKQPMKLLSIFSLDLSLHFKRLG